MSTVLYVVKLVDDNTYELFCNQCGESLGTMKGGQVMKAILHNVGRGGVMCPRCRGRVCKGCGYIAATKKALTEKGYCFNCEFERLQGCR